MTKVNARIIKHQEWISIDETLTFHKYTHQYVFKYDKSMVVETENFPLKINNPIYLVYFLNQPAFK